MHDRDTTFLTLILDGDRRRAEGRAREVFERNGITYLYERVIQPALIRVGELWYANELSVADEHLATATAEAALAALYPLLPWPPRGPRAVIACAEGERHQLGARMVADLLALDGWDERFVGADVPIDDLARKVRDVAPKMVGISVTLPAHIATARSAIARVRASSPDAKILVGGRAAEVVGVGSLGADAFARRGSEAAEVARAWK